MANQFQTITIDCPTDHKGKTKLIKKLQKAGIVVWVNAGKSNKLDVETTQENLDKILG